MPSRSPRNSGRRDGELRRPVLLMQTLRSVSSRFAPRVLAYRLLMLPAGAWLFTYWRSKRGAINEDLGRGGGCEGGQGVSVRLQS